MPWRDIIVVGASAGGIEPLKRLVSDLPPDLPASLFVVMHLPAWHKSALPMLLANEGPLPAMHADGREPVRPGRIYVAPPDYHMVLDDSHVQLWRGPKENRHRPAINALFRSAAVYYRERVIGVVLSGMLDDGASGLWWIKRFGGLAVVQDPLETAFPEMPRAALEHADIDYVAAAGEIGPLLVRLTREREGAHKERRL